MAKIRKSPSHLLRVGTTYHFRYSIPRQYHRFVSGEVRISLDTGSLKVARVKAAKLTSLTQGYLSNIVQGGIVIDNKKEIKAALGNYLRDLLEVHELGRLDGPAVPKKTNVPGLNVKPEVLLSLIEIDIRKQLKGHHGQRSVNVTAFLESLGLNDIEPESPTYKFAQRELLKVCQAVIKIEHERLKGNYNSPLELSILSNYPVGQQQATAPAPAKPKSTRRKRSIRLSKAIDQFIDENVSDGKWAPKSITEYTNRLALLPEVMGDCLLNEIDFDRARQFFDKLKQLPPNRTKIKGYRGKSISELLKMKLPPDKRMSGRTVNNVMQSVFGLFEWAVQRDLMAKNYAAGMRVKQTKRPDEAKESFTTNDLKSMFDSLTKEDGHKYWIPFVGLYTGARLEEICQLHVADVRREDDIWVIDINDKGDKRLKTLNSKRLVPIHKALLDAGFTDYVRQMESEGHERIFHELKRMKGKYGHYFSRSFSSQLKKMGLKPQGRKVSFHSLRHTFITKAKHSDLPEDYVKQIVGHSNQSITYGAYGKRYDIPKLKEIVDQVEYEIGGC